MGTTKKAVPETVSLVALGKSKTSFFNECMISGNKRGVADEVWVINKLGVLMDHDMLFRMDDLREARKCNEKSFMKGGKEVSVHDSYSNFMENHNKPIVTSVAYPEYPTSISYPLEGVINTVGYSYFRTTPAYAAAFAAHIGVKKLRIYGCDYIYPTNIYQAEEGKANLEFILGVIMQMGVEVWVPPDSTLLCANVPVEDKLYGYNDVIEVKPDEEDGKLWKVHIVEGKRKELEENKTIKEHKQLQELMIKYEDKVKFDLIDGKYITKKDIDDYEKQKFLDAHENASQEETLIGD